MRDDNGRRFIKAFPDKSAANRSRRRPSNKFLTTLGMIFDYAVRHEHVDRNPVDVVERCRRVVRAQSVAALSELAIDTELGEVAPATVLSAAQARQVIAKVQAGLYQTFLLTAVRTGARVGEITPLTRPDVDLQKARLHIRRSVSWAKRRNATTGGPGYGPPKTAAGRRRIPLRPELVAVLRRWKLACPPTADGFVFPSDTARPPCIAPHLHTRNYTRPVTPSASVGCVFTH
jgi:integrase